MLSNHLIFCHPFLLFLHHQGLFQCNEDSASDAQSIGALTSASVLPVNIQAWFSLGLTGLISLQSKGLSRVVSSNKIGRHQFFSAQSSLWSKSHIHIWLLHSQTLALTIQTSVGKVIFVPHSFPAGHQKLDLQSWNFSTFLNIHSSVINSSICQIVSLVTLVPYAVSFQLSIHFCCFFTFKISGCTTIFQKLIFFTAPNPPLQTLNICTLKMSLASCSLWSA